jgi:hypothetical protein
MENTGGPISELEIAAKGGFSICYIKALIIIEVISNIISIKNRIKF